MGNLIDLTGKQFGCWKIVSQAPSRVLNCGTNRTYWNIKCECGNEFEVLTRDIRRKRVFPTNCKKCPPKVKDKGGRCPHRNSVAHEQLKHNRLKPCIQSGPYPMNKTENIDEVTCTICLRRLRE